MVIPKQYRNLQAAGNALLQGNVFDSLDMIENYPLAGLEDDLSILRNSLSTMRKYILEGFDDNNRQQLYDGFLSEQNALLQRCLHDMAKKEHPVYISSVFDSRKMEVEPASIKSDLEQFVTSMAMVSLEVDEVRKEVLQHDMQLKHNDYMKCLFDKLWTCDTLSDAISDSIIEILLDDLIDTSDIQLMVSALTLGGVEFFDPNKLRILINVYKKSTDEYVRQRALVGVIFVYQKRTVTTSRMIADMKALLSDKASRNEIFDLQKQIILSSLAEKDKKTIEGEIIPDIMKHRDTLKFSRFGIEEKEDDELQNILHPNASEEAMDDVMDNMQKLTEMQRNGRDIYFGGFAQMKSFSFFGSISNWFIPFSMDNPEVSAFARNKSFAELMEFIVNGNLLCDSDKYSLCLSMAQYTKDLSDSLRESLMANKEIISEGMGDVQTLRQSPSFIRRSYMQDLYRFYKVSYLSKDMNNPFFSDSLFSDKELWMDELKPDYYNLVRFYLDTNGMQADQCAFGLLKIFPQRARDYEYHLLSVSRAPNAQEYLEMLMYKENDEIALRGLAREMEEGKEFVAAETYYRKLVEHYPKINYETSLCCCLMEQSKFEEALQRLFKIDVEHHEYVNARRALGWGLFCTGKLEQAESYYREILESGNTTIVDCLNAGHVALSMKDYQLAKQRYSRYIALSLQKGRKRSYLREAVKADREILNRYGVTDADIFSVLSRDNE